MLQSTLFTRLNLYDVPPNLVLACVSSWTLLRGVREGAVWAFVGGLALDLLSAQPLGLSAFALLLVVGVLGLSEGHVDGRLGVLPVAGALLATVVYNGVLLAALAFGGRALGPLEPLLTLHLAALVLNVLISWPLHKLLGLLYSATEQGHVSSLG